MNKFRASLGNLQDIPGLSGSVASAPSLVVARNQAFADSRIASCYVKDFAAPDTRPSHLVPYSLALES